MNAAIVMPNPAQPKPAIAAMKGTASIPQLGSRPNTIATRSGAQPYTPARTEIQIASPVTSSSVSTGAARIASYVRWNWYLTKVPNIAGKPVETSTAVATVPVPTNSTYRKPATVDTSEPNPNPNATR